MLAWSRRIEASIAVTAASITSPLSRWLEAHIALAIGLCFVASPGYAQCPTWKEGFHTPGVGIGSVHSLTVFDDGSGSALYLGGAFATAGDVSASNIARWDGQTWSALGGGTDNEIDALAVFDDGSGPALYAAGSFTEAGGVSANKIARWNGASWSALGSGIGGTFVWALAVFDDGSGPALYVGGSFTSAGGVSTKNLARWNGATWSSVGNGTNLAVRALCVFDDGSGPALYAGGSFTGAGEVHANHVARWDGTTWTSAGMGTDGGVQALAVFDDGSGRVLYAGGSFTTAGGVDADNIAKWDGTAWSAVGQGVDSNVQALTVFDDGTQPALYAGGFFTSAGGVAVTHVARWDGATWSALGDPVVGFTGGVLALAVFAEEGAEALYAGGHFAYLTTATGITGKVARWDGSAWSGVGSAGAGTSARVRALTVFDDGSEPKLIAAGDFPAAGGTLVKWIAQWDGSGWSALGSGLSDSVAGPPSGTNDGVWAVTVFDDGTGPALYAGGRFHAAGGAPAENIARWDGTSWSAAGSGLSAYVTCLAGFDDGNGPELYAGGWFGIARFDGTSWSAPGGGVDGDVRALLVFDDGSGPALYAAGSFTMAGGVTVQDIAKWNGTTWSAVGNGTNQAFSALAVFDDGSGAALYAGGRFTRAGGEEVGCVAKLEGSIWSSLAGGVGGSMLSDQVNALAVFDDGTGPALYAAGEFASAGGVDASRIARWDGTSWSGLDRGIGGGSYAPVNALAVFDDGSGAASHLYVGGEFGFAGTTVASNFVQWQGCGHPGEEICAGDGSGQACPCANSGLAGHGCENSALTGGALLDSSGWTSLAFDSLVLTSWGELASALSVFLQGDEQTAPTAFGDGLNCTGGLLTRLYVKQASAGTVAAPQGSEPSISARSAALGDSIPVGETRVYQVFYRDPDPAFCPSPLGGTWNITNGLRIGWLP